MARLGCETPYGWYETKHFTKEKDHLQTIQQFSSKCRTCGCGWGWDLNDGLTKVVLRTCLKNNPRLFRNREHEDRDKVSSATISIKRHRQNSISCFNGIVLDMPLASFLNTSLSLSLYICISPKVAMVSSTQRVSKC